MHHRPDSDDDTGQGGHSPRRSARSRRLAKAALFGGFVALLTRAGVRGRVLDALFGPEEEFEYESETEPEPLSDLSAGAAGEPEDHDEQPDAPAEDEPREFAGASWEPPSAQDRNPHIASPVRPDDQPPAGSDPRPLSAPDEAREPPLAPRIFAVPSVPAPDPPIEEADAPPAAPEAVEPDPPASHIRTPPASYLTRAAVSDVPDTGTERASPPPSAAPEPTGDGDGGQPDRDRRYSWGGDAAVEVPAPAAGEEPPGEEHAPAGGGATVDVPRPLPHVDELTTLRPSPGVLAPPGGPPRPTHEDPVFPRAVEPEAVATPPDPTEPPSRGPRSRFEPLAQVEPDASDDFGAPAESESWAIAPPFVIGEEPSGREPDVEPWRTAPSIVIENGDLIEDRETAAPVTTPWKSSETNGGKTPRPWASPEVPSAEGLVRDAPPEGAAVATVDPGVTTTEPARADSSPAPASVETVAPADGPTAARVEGLLATAASEESAGETAVPAATAVGADSAVAPSASPESPEESLESLVAAMASAESAVASAAPAENPVAAPAPAESPAATTAPAESPAATAERPAATAERAEPAIGEAAPRRSGWWLSRRRRGPAPEPPRWD